MKRKILKKGETVIITSGEFSDYSTHELCVVNNEFNIDSIMEEYLCINPDERNDYYFKTEKFVMFLINKELITPINYSEFYIGSYVGANPNIWGGKTIRGKNV